VGRLRDAWLTFIKHTLNKGTSALARSGRGPFSLVIHVGRKSGRQFETPIMVASAPDGFVAELTYGDVTKITHIPVRIEDDSVSLNVTHTLVVANRTLTSEDLQERLLDRSGDRPHRYTIIAPAADDVSEATVARNLASVLAKLYHADIDATGQPMSPDPFDAVKNAIEHYRVDEILISTLSGEESHWLKQDLVGRVREITDKAVIHHEAGRPPEAVAAGTMKPPGHIQNENTPRCTPL